MNLMLLKSLSLFTKEEAVIRNLPGGYVTFHTCCGETGRVTLCSVHRSYDLGVAL